MGNGNPNGKPATAWAVYTKVALIFIPALVMLMTWVVSEAFASRAFRNQGRRLTYADGQAILEKLAAAESRIVERITTTDRAIRGDMALLFAQQPSKEYQASVATRFAEQSAKIDKLLDGVHELRFDMMAMRLAMGIPAPEP